MTDITLERGYALSIDEGSPQALTLRAPDGRACLSIVLGPDGPQVVVEAAELAVKTTGKVAFACETFALEARGDVAIAAGGQVEVVADGGGIDLVANDAVTLEGERVNLDTGALGPSGALARRRGLR